MTNAAISENNTNHSFIQSASQVLGTAEKHALETEVKTAQNAESFSPTVAALDKKDLDYIRTHGARKYAEELQKKIVDEIRQELLNLMGSTQESLSEISELQRQTLEGLIAVEIDARLNASFAADLDQTEKNGPYLKAMILSQGNYGVFDEKPVISLEDFKKQASLNA